jgi:hypothetical protein
MNRRQMLMVTLPLVAAPTLLMAQAKNPPPAPVAKAEARRDPYAPTEVAIRPDFEVGSIVVVSKDFLPLSRRRAGPGDPLRRRRGQGRTGLEGPRHRRPQDRMAQLDADARDDQAQARAIRQMGRRHAGRPDEPAGRARAVSL